MWFMFCSWKLIHCGCKNRYIDNAELSSSNFYCYKICNEFNIRSCHLSSYTLYTSISPVKDLKLDKKYLSNYHTNGQGIEFNNYKWILNNHLKRNIVVLKLLHII